MAGVKGRGGPPPKRTSQRRRANKPEGVQVTHGTAIPVEHPPEADPAWHLIAREWYESLARSGQATWYEASDYATARVLAEAMSRELVAQPIVLGSGESARVEMHPMPMKGATLSALLKGMTALMVTEGDRRRARLELERPKGEEVPAGVSELDEYRKRVASPDAG